MYKQTLKWEAARQKRGKVAVLAWTCVMLYWEICGLEMDPTQTSSMTVWRPQHLQQDSFHFHSSLEASAEKTI